MKKLLVLLSYVSLVFALIGCSGSRTTRTTELTAPYPPVSEPYYEIPRDLIDDYSRLETIYRYRKYLEGIKIYIDPGHGGNDRINKSIMGNIIEADVNLKVALYLKEFLEEAGVTVLMSRTEDITVELETRSELANKSGADIFISIHHNASGNGNDYWTNYTSTFYHSREVDEEFEPCERDLARYIQRDLSYVMSNPGGLISFDGTVSDYSIFPGEGFSVLRKTEIPAVLVECAFYTNRREEQRLAIDEFNRIQAWGIFRGIGKYFSAGIPVVTLLQDESRLNSGQLELVFQFYDTNGVNPKTIVVYFDDREIEYQFFIGSNKVVVNIPNVLKGEHNIRVLCANKNGNHSFPYKKKLLLQ